MRKTEILVYATLLFPLALAGATGGTINLMDESCCPPISFYVGGGGRRRR